ncbi:MAG: methyltransferase domain-containing protein [Gammaproteobacteria bacterium]|nr:methyltransferase domain-containing protein [Gammaproteobacteria bacterium]
MDNEQRKQMIQQGFDTVASGYDHPSLPFFPQTASRLIEHLQLTPEQHLLDVCCGTGAVSLKAAEALSHGRVLGIDLSSGMLQQAQAKAEAAGHSNTEFRQMDIEALDLPAHSFDVATSSFGLFFIEDMAGALTGIASKVKPGGKVAITSFTGDAFAPMSDIFIKNFEATGRTVPPLSWQRLATRELIEEQFNAAGITDIDIHHVPLGYQMTSDQQWWDVVWNAGWRSLLTNFTGSKIERTTCGRKANYREVICSQMSPEEQQEFEQKHRQEIKAVIGEEGVWFNTEVLIGVGRK